MEPFSQSDFAKLDKERARLDEESSQALEVIQQLNNSLSSAALKLRRLDKQKKYLASREAEMISRGLENVEEMERVEAEEERQKAASSSASATVPQGSPVFNFDDVDFGSLPSPSSFFLEPVPSDGTAQ